MHLTVTRTTPILSHRMAIAGLRFAVAGASLLALLVLAPRLYEGNHDLQSYHREVTYRNRLHGRLIASLRRRGQDIVDEAERFAPGKDGYAYLQKALVVAQADLAIRELNLKTSQRELDHGDTAWNRISGNKCLDLMRMQVDEHTLLVDMARRHLERLKLVARRKTVSSPS